MAFKLLLCLLLNGLVLTQGSARDGHDDSESVIQEIVAQLLSSDQLQEENAEARVTKSESICTLPPETGPCRAYIPMYYFNSKTDQCDMFIYGGCLGNDNRFSTKKECEQVCDREITTIQGRPGYCYLPPQRGPCRARIPRYYYNPLIRCCEEFIYGGCGGNPNNFRGFQECNSKCQSLCRK